MKTWWEKKKSRTRKSRKTNERYTKGDLLADVLFWLPEIIIFPIRMIFWILRASGRFIKDFFDFA